MKHFNINGRDISKYIVAVPEGGYAERHIAKALFDGLDMTDTETQEGVIHFGRTENTEAEPKKGEYIIKVTDNGVEAVADSVFGYVDISERIEEILAENTEWKSGDEWTGKIKHAPRVYDERDVCILWHNVLGYEIAYPPLDRPEMGFELYMEYAPDVIGLQEMSFFYYERAQVLLDEFKKNNYGEIRFPRYGYGNPIYYNIKTLELMECGYRKAEKVIDKGTTWAIFKHKKTNKLFCVINSHFAADSNANHDHELGIQYRVEDAKVMLGIVEMTKQRYPDIPIFAGGDYNDLPNTLPVKTVLDGGMTPIADTTENASEYTAYNGHPKLENGSYRLGSHYYRGTEWSLDHAFVGGVKESVRVLDYYIPCDRLSCTLSDHLPHLVQFKFI